MQDEEMASLIKELAEQLEGMPDDPEKPLTKDERGRKIVLRLRHEALKRIQTAREKGNPYQEMRASVDYAILTQFGHKHPLLVHLLKSQAGLWYGL